MPAKRLRLTAGLLATTASIATTCALAGPALAIPASNGPYVPVKPAVSTVNPAQQNMHASTALALAQERLHQRGSLAPAATTNAAEAPTESSSTATVALVLAAAAMLIALVAATASFVRSRQPVART